MKRIFLTILSVASVIIILLWSFFWYALEYEKFNKYLCESSGSFLVDSLNKEYKIWGGSNYPKNFCGTCSYYDSTKVDCKIINCNLNIKETNIDFQQDSLIKKIANIFWSFPQNSEVDSLYLSINNNSKTIQSNLTKTNWQIPIKKFKYDSTASINDFKIINQFDGQEHGGGGDFERYQIEIRKIKILINKDLNDYSRFAEKIMANNLRNCKEKNIAKLEIVIVTQNPKGSLTNTKQTEYFYDLIPMNEYYIKKKNL
jgi:hypothetical protein